MSDIWDSCNKSKLETLPATKVEKKCHIDIDKLLLWPGPLPVKGIFIVSKLLKTKATAISEIAHQTEVHL